MLKKSKMKSTLISLFIPFKLSKNTLELWMQTRHEEGLLNGFLEFPGGKIEAGESPKEAALREFIEEVPTGREALRVERVSAFKNYSFDYLDRSVILFTFIGQMSAGDLEQEGWYKIDFERPLENIEDKIPQGNHELIIDLSSYFHGLVEDGSWSELWAPL